MTVLTGIDAAHWQGVLPVEKLAVAGISFAIVKATHGLGLNPDVQFVKSFAALGRSSLIRGAYHWFTDADPVTQAEFFVRVLETAGYSDGDLPLALDFEEPETKYRGLELVDRLRACSRRVEVLTGRPVIIYSGDWFWGQRPGDGFAHGVDAPDLVARCLYWHSQYPRLEIRNRLACATEPIALPNPRLPKPWRDRGVRETFWQWDGTGGCLLPNGVDADFNRFDGSIDQLRAICARRLDSFTFDDVPDTEPQTPKGKSEPRFAAVREPIADLSSTSPATPLRAAEGVHTPIDLTSEDDT